MKKKDRNTVEQVGIITNQAAVVRQAMAHGLDTSAMTNIWDMPLELACMRMLAFSLRVTRKGTIMNEHIRYMFGQKIG